MVDLSDQEGERRMKADKVQQLSGVELDFAYAKAHDCHMIGSPKGPFAIYAERARTLWCFGQDSQIQKDSSFCDNLIASPLHEAMEYGASISVKNGIVRCEIDDLTTTGDSIAQALLRCLILRHTSPKISGK